MCDQGWAGFTAGHSCGAVEVGYLSCRGHRRDGRIAVCEIAASCLQKMTQAVICLACFNDRNGRGTNLSRCGDRGQAPRLRPKGPHSPQGQMQQATDETGHGLQSHQIQYPCQGRSCLRRPDRRRGWRACEHYRPGARESDDLDAKKTRPGNPLSAHWPNAPATCRAAC